MAYCTTFFSASLLWRSFCLRQSSWNFNSFPVSVTGISSPLSRMALAASTTCREENKNSYYLYGFNTAFDIVCMQKRWSVISHCTICGLEWPHVLKNNKSVRCIAILWSKDLKCCKYEIKLEERKLRKCEQMDSFYCKLHIYIYIFIYIGFKQATLSNYLL